MRAYLARTETFVHNQITTLRRHRPIVIAHHRRPDTDAPLAEGAIAYEKVALPSGVAALASYVREQDARLLHYHYLTDARFLLGVKRRTDLPAIVSGYGYDVSWFPRQWHGLGRR